MSWLTIIILLSALVLAATALYLSRKAGAQPQRPDPLDYIEGLKALLRGQDEQAFMKLKDTVSADTSNIDAYIQLGNIFRRRKKAEQALRVHSDLTFRDNLTEIQKKEILVSLYHDFMDMDDESSALKATAEILGLNPNDRFALSALLRAHENLGEWKEAAGIRRKLDKLDGQDSKRMLALYKIFEGEDLLEEGDPHRARLFFKEAIHFDKMCLAAYIAIGDSYYTDKRLDDAIGYWSKVITLKPELGHLVFERLKKGFFEIGRYGEYAEALTGLIQACPEHLTARLELAYFQEKKGEIDAAREHFTVAVDNHPDSMMARLGLYRLNLGTGRKEASDTVFKQLLKMAVHKEAQNFRCRNCALDSQNMVWLCPRCKTVDSFETVKS